MKNFVTVGLTSSAVAALFVAASIALTGCVTEEVPPPEIHTSAYVVPEADAAATGDLPARRNQAATTTATNSAPQGNSSQTTSAPAPAAPMVPPPVVALPPPPVAALPPPPVVVP
jgi:hypothetical protein